MTCHATESVRVQLRMNNQRTGRNGDISDGAENIYYGVSWFNGCELKKCWKVDLYGKWNTAR